MHFRARRKLQNEVSLSDTLEAAGEEGNLSLMDVIAVEDDMQEQLDAREACRRVRRCVEELSPRESRVIRLRYGLEGGRPLTQREVAKCCGISRSYVSRIEKKALERMREAMDGWDPFAE